MGISRRQLLKRSLGVSLAMSLPAPFVNAWADDAKAATLPLTIHSQTGPNRLDVEVAETVSQRQQGLMGREHLAETRGMLFRFESEQPANHSFWMYRTLIPLDIAYIDEEGRIVAINTMPPCESITPRDCPAYPAGAAYFSALEVNAGYFAERGIQVGDCVSVPELAGFCQPE